MSLTEFCSRLILNLQGCSEEVIFDESSAEGLWKHIGVKSMKVSPSEKVFFALYIYTNYIFPNYIYIDKFFYFNNIKKGKFLTAIVQREFAATKFCEKPLK